MSCVRLAAGLLVALAIATGAAEAQPKQPETMPPAPPPTSTPMIGPAAPSPLQPGDAFGEAVVLPERTIIYLKGHANWSAAFDTLIDAFKSLNEYLDKQNLKPNGPAMTIYTETNDKGFSFQAALPLAKAPADPPKGDIAVGQAPAGKALKFVHRGSYDAMDSSYEAITNYLDDKGLEAKEMFIEEYASDPGKTDPDQLVINVFVPLK